MPGRLIMEQESAEDAVAGKGAGAPPMVNGFGPHSQLDGLSDAPNGYLANGHPTSSGDMATSSSILDLPPEIRQMMAERGPPPEIRHISEGFQPLGKLIVRAAQECYNDLGEVIDDLAQTEAPQQPNGLPNGVNHRVGASAPGEATPASAQKRTTLMNFAHRRRDMFIKLWILSQWSRQAEDVSKLIDIWTWQREAMEKFENAAYFTGDIKISMQSAKMPNPDIKTALEVLSTGKASWMPDLNYIPREPLDAEEMADILQNLNSELSIRLNLHESLPPHLQNWSVASGRATFVIPGEFEFDVSIADEDPSSQFWFVDIRFLLSPAPQVSDDSKNIFQDHCNAVLGAEGLARCYDFLHNFTLTHKLSILRRQAHEMNAGPWQDSLRIEHVHRVLVIQYWTDTPGGKNWLEFGVLSGASKDGNVPPAEAAQPRNGMRWFRKGTEVDDSVSLHWQDISMEVVMKHVIARHTSLILSSIHERLLAAADANRAFSADLSTSNTEPGDCALRVWLESPDNDFTLKIDVATGRLTLWPITAVSARTEIELNRMQSPAVDSSVALVYCLCRSIQNNVVTCAESIGWKQLRHIRVKPDALKAALNQDVFQYSFFRGRGWDSNWAIVASFTPLGLTWWVVEVSDGVLGGSITTAIGIPSPKSNGQPEPVSEALLGKIERMAAAAVSMRTTARDLRQRKIPFSAREELALSSKQTSTASSAHQVVALYVRLSKLLQQDRKEPNAKSSWASDFVRLVYHGFDAKQRKVLHIAKGSLAQQANLSKLLKNSNNEDFIFHRNGAFSLVLRSPFGVSFIKQLTLRLQSIERLQSIVEVLQKRKFKIDKISPSSVVFRYGGKADLSADISFTEGAWVTLNLAPDNPHQRVSVWLIRLLNDGETGFDTFATMLLISLPLLRAFQSIEKREGSASDRPSIHSQSIDWHSIVYPPPLPSFSVRLRMRRDEFQWHIQDSGLGSKAHQQRPQPLRAALQALFSEEGDDWRGVGAGIVAGFSGIEEALPKLDEVVGKHAVVERAAAAHEQPQPTETRRPQQPQQPQHEVINID